MGGVGTGQGCFECVVCEIPIRYREMWNTDKSTGWKIIC